MSDYPMLISNKLHSFRNFWVQEYTQIMKRGIFLLIMTTISVVHTVNA